MNDNTELLRGTGVAIGLALAVNLVVFLAGTAGAPIRVITGWAPDGTDLRYADVVVATVVLLAIGTGVLWLLQRWRDDGFRLWVVLVVAFTLLSIPPVLRLDVDAGSKLTLAVMHLVVGAAALLGQRGARAGARRSVPALSA
jgi:hypothetical protein